jgi:hypothetical protein
MDPLLKVVPEIKPVGIGTFAGALDYNNLSWLNKKILKSKGSPEGDFRDWNAIALGRGNRYMRSSSMMNPRNETPRIVADDS